MNVLFVLPYCYIEGKGIGWKTGFGIYTNKLAEELAKRAGIKVYILPLRLRLRENLVINHVTYLGFHEVKIVKSLLKKGSLKKVRHITKNSYYKQNILKKTAVSLYAAGKSNCLSEVVEKYHIELIHIHSFAPELYGIFESDIPTSSNTLVTVHGGCMDEPGMLPYNQYVFSTMNKLVKKGIHISFVSSGVRDEYIKKITSVKEPLNVCHVILNGTDERVSDKSNKPDNDRKILLCVGSVCERKNQKQLLEAIRNFDKGLRDKFMVYVIGQDLTQGEFDALIKKYGLENSVINLGFVAPGQVKDYYVVADGNIVLSKEEAFGLSIIEAFQYGVPTLCFKDIGAANDLYHECAVQFFEDRSTESVARGIQEFLFRTWDDNAIRKWGVCFQLEKIMDSYMGLYHKLLSSGTE